MTNNDEVYFDESSGISVEEQQEIFSAINGIAEKNRRSLSDTSSGSDVVINTKKKDALFPVVVNVAALLILAVGVFLLLFFNQRRDIDIREGGRAFTVTEREIIEEIRRDTAQRIAAKEMEIAAVFSQLESIDAELMLLYSATEDLTAEQLATQQRLYAMQNEYRANLDALHEERSQILEASRSREAQLRALLDERTREFAAARQRAEDELDSAMLALEHLTGEQERAAALDAQLAGGITTINSLIQNGDFDQAAQTAANLRSLNNSGVFSSRAFQARREFYNQALDSLEASILLLRVSEGFAIPVEAPPDITEELEVQVQQLEQQAQQLEARNQQLELQNRQLAETNTDMQRRITTYTAGAGEQVRRISELETSVSTLQAANTSLEASVQERNREISSIQVERDNLAQTVSDLRAVSEEQDQEILNLTTQIEIIRQLLQN